MAGTPYHSTKTLDELCDEVQDQGVVIIRRPGKPNIALIFAKELSGLKETLHLLSSPKNAERLLAAMHRARSTSDSA